MFIIELTYRADLSKIDAAMQEHMAFLERAYAAGMFLVSGRKVPREGGIIIAVAASRAEVEAMVQQDPFVAQGLAEVRIIEFSPSQRSEQIQQRVDAEAQERRGARRMS